MDTIKNEGAVDKCIEYCQLSYMQLKYESISKILQISLLDFSLEDFYQEFILASLKKLDSSTNLKNDYFKEIKKAIERNKNYKIEIEEKSEEFKKNNDIGDDKKTFDEELVTKSMNRILNNNYQLDLNNMTLIQWIHTYNEFQDEIVRLKKEQLKKTLNNGK